MCVCVCVCVFAWPLVPGEINIYFSGSAKGKKGTALDNNIFVYSWDENCSDVTYSVKELGDTVVVSPVFPSC
jgi:hypothetical protein